MRFGRTILAGLAPLLGLSAFMAAMAAGPNPLQETGHPLAGLLRSVVLLVSPDAEQATINVSPDRPSPQAVLGFAVLAATPFRHSVWMVASLSPAPFVGSQQWRSPLRC